MEFSQPPPDLTKPPVNFSVPPPIATAPPPRHSNLVVSDGNGPPPPSGPIQTTGGGSGHSHGAGGHSGHGGGGGRHHSHYGGHHYYHQHGAGKPGHPYFKPFINFGRGPGGIPMTQDDFDGKRLRKSVMRKTVDYNAAIVKAIENRVWQRDHRDRHALQPESIYIPELLPPPSYMDNPSNAVTTRFVKTATNKMRCPIFTLAWTPEGRRLVTGASSGEFTLWNGLTFNFETILQAHDVPVRTMVWSHNDNWMVTGDHGGYVKYWQSNMNNVKMFQAHKEPIRGISFSPTDSKFVSCSDDGTLRVWDFLRCQEERVLRGHGADVKCVHWHPQKALIVSGSKDNQQPIKLWDPKSGQALATLHAHKSTVMDLKWNDNGNWLVTASRDHLLKLFDLRNLREEVQVFRGHKKEASSVTWHPVHEGLFCSGGSDGAVLFWNVGTDKEIGGIDTAHDSIVWTLAWHPLGHILCSGSNDHTIKFWTRNRPGDQMRDKYNLNTLPASLAGLDECDIEDNLVIPGMGPEDKVEFTESLTADTGFIPGLELDTSNIEVKNEKKVPYSKPIPRNFQAQWNDTGRSEDAEENASKEIKEVITQIVENTPGVVPLEKIAPTAIIVYGKMIPVIPGGKLQAAILAGPNSLNKFISSGQIEELNDIMPFEETKPVKSDSDRTRSPPVKKSRFSDAPRDHNAQMIYGNDIDLRQFDQQQHQQQQQQAIIQPPPPPQTFIPPLLTLKLPQPNDYGPPLDEDFRTFNNINNNSSFNDSDDRQLPTIPINPWATAPPIIAAGLPNNFNQIVPGNNFINNNNNNNFRGVGEDDLLQNFNSNGNSQSGNNTGGSGVGNRVRNSRFNDNNNDNFRNSGNGGNGSSDNNNRRGGNSNQDFRRGSNNNSNNNRNQSRNRNKNRRF